VGNQTLSLTFSASDRLEFPEGADRPVNATWGRAYDVDYCGTTHREHVAFRVRNNGPITTGPGVASPTSAGTNTGRAVVGQNNRRRRSPPDHEYTYPGDDEDDIF
jgi:hypothetical protein